MKDADRQLLHQFYVASRALMASGVVPDISVQRSFDGVIEGYRGEDSWRPSHITLAAAERLSVGVTTGIQRAHGILAGRMDRYERTMLIFTGPEQDFDDWWGVWTSNDATVLVTREEHIVNRKLGPEEVVPIPPELNLFGTGGFSFKFRKKYELAWLKTWAGVDGK
jgi:hypothetical protein